MDRHFLAVLASTLALCTTLPVHAVGRLVDVQVVDRDSGQTLTPIFHQGVWWIAGRPGARYGVTLLSRTDQRTLNVVSVDGVNAISGDTAAWNQTGYVLLPYQRTQIDGWRKDAHRIAAFEFTALPDSYAARTGRPADVGVIGVALFSERRVAPIARRDVAPAEAERGEPLRSAAPSSDAAPAPAPMQQSQRFGQALADRSRIGTGHGAIESSSIDFVDFQRARTTPDEIVTIRYDRVENLIAMGIVAAPYPPVAKNTTPNPFPNSVRFVADPPSR